MKRKPTIFNQARLQAMMDRKGIDLVILRGTENSKYISEFFHNGANLGYRPFTVFYFRDPARKPAFVVPAVDLHLAMDSTWTCGSTRTSSKRQRRFSRRGRSGS
jgi:Xaa-Pro aminopeptidase